MSRTPSKYHSEVSHLTLLIVWRSIGLINDISCWKPVGNGEEASSSYVFKRSPTCTHMLVSWNRIIAWYVKMIYIDTDLLVLAGYEDFHTFPPSWRVRCCLLRFTLIQNSKKRLSLVMFHHSSRRRDHHMRSHGNEAFTIDLDSNPNATVNSLIRGSFVPDFDFTSASHRWHSASRGRTHRTICQRRYPFPLGQNPGCGRTLCEE